MRAVFFLFSLITLLGCGNQQLSEEQRKELQKELKKRKPVILKDEAFILKTFEIARSSWKDTTASGYQWEIFTEEPAKDPVLRELWTAYTYSFEQGDAIPDDNVQLTDSLIYYSRPLHEEGDFEGIAILAIPKKDIALLLTQEDQ